MLHFYQYLIASPAFYTFFLIRFRENGWLVLFLARLRPHTMSLLKFSKGE